jgi:hypothetical protein
LAEGILDVGRHIGVAAPDLHGVEGGGEGQGESVEVMLKFAVTSKAKTANDAHNRGWVGVQALGHGADAEKDVFAGMLENGANDLLALGAEMVDAFRKIDG